MLYIIVPLILAIGYLIVVEHKYSKIEFGDIFLALVLCVVGILTVVMINCTWFAVTRSTTPDLVNNDQIIENEVKLMLVDEEHYLQRTIDNCYIYNYDTDIGIISDREDVTRSYIKYIDKGETPRLVNWYTKSKSKIVSFAIDTKTSYYTFYIPEGSILVDIK